MGDTIFTIVIILLILLSLLYIFHPSISNLLVGLFKNKRIKAKLKRLVNNYDYIYLNDLCLRVGRGRYMDVGNVLFADKNIYVIETKFWLGYVNGSDEDEKWLLSDGKNLDYVENPLRYNEQRIRALSVILDVSIDNFINVVCIAKSCKVKEMNVHMRSCAVVGEDELINYLKTSEQNSNLHVYNSDELEKKAAKLYDYHKASLEDKSLFSKSKGRY